MRTAKQREDEFRADLKALLAKKHKAELDITDDGGATECTAELPW